MWNHIYKNIPFTYDVQNGLKEMNSEPKKCKS